MKIHLSPVRADTPLVLRRDGDTLWVNEEAFDFELLGENEELDPTAVSSPFFIGPIRRLDGVLELSLMLPHGEGAPEETRFPSSLDVPDDGAIALPPFDMAPDPLDDED